MSEASEPQFDVSRFNQKDNLVKTGDEINLTQRDPALKNLKIGLGWELNSFGAEALDVDASCFLLDKNEKTRFDTDFIFYNNPEGCEGAVKHNGDSRHGAGEGDDETLTLSIPGVPFDVVRIVIVVSIYGASLNEQNLGMMKNGYVRLVNDDRNEELLRYEFSSSLGRHKESAMVVGILDREGPKWHFHPKADFYNGGLAELATKYGIVIAEKGS